MSHSDFNKIKRALEAKLGHEASEAEVRAAYDAVTLGGILPVGELI